MDTRELKLKKDEIALLKHLLQKFIIDEQFRLASSKDESEEIEMHRAEELLRKIIE